MKRKAVAALLAAAAIRIAAVAGLGETAAIALSELVSGVPVTATVTFQLAPTPGVPAAEDTPPPLTPSPAPTPTPTPEVTPEPSPIAVAVTEAKIEVNNATGFDIDCDALLGAELALTLPAEGPQVLIVHTHGSEAYTPDMFDSYVASDVSRTEDRSYNVVRVGDELTAALKGYGLEVLHDRELYDYPTYSGSYGRSAEAIEGYLEQWPDIAVVIDLHRDAISSGDVVYKTKAAVAGASSAQVMLVVGTGENGLYHPDWRENMKLALHMQRAMQEYCPTLARPLAVKPERYNQQLTAGSLILEVGSSGNTLQEALTAVRLYADAVGPLLAGLAE